MSFCAAETIRIQEQDKSVGGVVQNDEADARLHGSAQHFCTAVVCIAELVSVKKAGN